MADQPPIIIKKIKKGGHAHHGGAWKVAYADFVTAMMAFFLLLWLLNVTTDIQRKGIADYFAPASISKSESGAGGIFGGRSLTAPEAKFSNSAPPGLDDAEPKAPGYRDERNDDYDAEMRGTGEPDQEKGKTGKDKTRMTLDKRGSDKGGKKDNELGDVEDYEKVLKQIEEKKFKEAEKALHNAIAQTADLQPLAKSLIVDQTEQGLRIQIVDQENYSMFPSGSAQMFPQTRTLLELVGKAVALLPNKLAITGHTDSNPFATPAQRDNWDLSAERANASRRVLTTMGISEDRFQTVVGRADRDPYIKNDPKDPRNRRISIILLRQTVNDMLKDQAASPANNTPAAQDATTGAGE